MSAFVVSDAHINALVNYIHRHRMTKFLGELYKLDEERLLDIVLGDQ